MQLGVNCSIKGKVSHEECRRCALNEHPCEYPVDVLEMMREQNTQDFERTEFTPSSLLECPRRVALRVVSDYYIKPENAWNLIRGDMAHKLLEERGSYPPGSVVDLFREVRLKTTVETKYGPQVFSGKSDLIVLKQIDEDSTAHVKIVDYKTKKKIEHDLTAADRKHQMQLNQYAYLVEKEFPKWLWRTVQWVKQVIVDELEVVYIDMSKVRRFTTERPLTTKGKLINRSTWEYAPLELEQMHLLPMEVVEAWIVQEIEARIEAKTVLPPPLEGDEARICPYCPMQEHCFRLAGKVL